MPTAIFIDGGFFLRRFRCLQGRRAPTEVAEALHWMCREHLKHRRRDRQTAAEPRQLYRIFYYDCPPLSKKVHNPVTGLAIDFSRSELAGWRLSCLRELKKKRKVAVRLGYLNDRSARWILREEVLKRLLSGQLPVAQLAAEDVQYEVRQKGVDMRLGLDVASLAYKRLVDQMILVAGDSDFVPAAKLARREGIDFILDPMWAPIRDDLHEHIDGLRSVLQRPGSSPLDNPTPRS